MRSRRLCGADPAQCGCIVGVKLKPASSRERIVSVGTDEICCAVTAAPVDGKANEAMIRLFAKALDIPKSSIGVRRGATSRNKLVEIAGMAKEEVMNKMKKLTVG
jgi:uncharacterized protein